MIDFLAGTRGLTKHQAYQLVSMAANVAITNSTTIARSIPATMRLPSFRQF